MSKSAKILVTAIVFVLVVLGVVGSVLALTPQRTTPQGFLNSQLEAPKNLKIDNNWNLSFDAVENAVAYEIYVDGKPLGQKFNEISVNVSQYATAVGKHSFGVKALHEISSYNSELSVLVYQTRTEQLSTPRNLSINNTVLTWGSVTNSASYHLRITFAGGQEDYCTTVNNSFDLAKSGFLDMYPDINQFAISVKASARNIGQETENEYILDSEYTEPVYYSRVQTIETPVLRAQFEVSPNVILTGVDSLVVYWNTDDLVNQYQLVMGNQVIKTFNKEEFADLDTIEVDLMQLTNIDADSLGSKSVQVRAIPITSGNISAGAKVSNTIEYIIKEKLATPNANRIMLTKEGENLKIDWESIDNADSYKITIWGNTNPDEQSEYTKVSIGGFTEILWNSVTPSYVQELSQILTGYKSFKAQVKACRTGDYYIDSEYSELSEAFYAVSKLPTPTNISLNEREGIYEVSWASVGLSAVSGYSLEIYTATKNTDDTYTALAKVATLLSKASDAPLLIISNKMAELNLEPGYYAFKMCTIANTNNKFYEDSDFSNIYGFKYKTQLETPEILVCQKQDESQNDSTIVLSWTYIEGAESYTIKVGDKALTISQPSQRPEDDIITDTQVVTEYIASFGEPKVYNITVQAIASLADDNHINSATSVAAILKNKYQHSAVDASTITFQNVANKVTMSWGAVETAGKDIVNPYTVILPGHSISTGGMGTRLSGLEEYLTPGINTIGIMVTSYGLYSDSDITYVEYEYTYDLGVHSDIFVGLNFEFQKGASDAEHRVKITIPSIDKNITSYYLEFTDYLGVTRYLNADCTSGQMCDVLASLTEVPLYHITDIKIWAGKGANGELQSQYIIPVCLYVNENPTNDADKVIYHFDNDLYMHQPTLVLNEETYELKINLLADAVNYTGSIHWSIQGGVDEILQSSDIYGENVTSSNSIDLNKYLRKSNGEYILGEYIITATIYSKNSSVVSDDAVKTFVILKKLEIDTTSFKISPINVYLQWNSVQYASGYNVIVIRNGTQIGDSEGNVSELLTETYENGVAVVRLDTTSLLTQTGEYIFTIIAKGNAAEFRLDSEPVTYTWQFDTKLQSPEFEIIEINGAIYAKVTCMPLVDTYKAIVNTPYENTVTGLYGTSVETINILLTFANAGTYTVSVIAMPKNADLYQDSDATTKEYVYKTNFSAISTFTLTQTLTETENSITATWNGDVLGVLFDNQGNITPETVTITFRDKNNLDFEPKLELTVNYGQYAGYILPAEFLDSLRSQMYAVSIKVNGVEPYFNTSTEKQITFVYQERTKTPTVMIDDKLYGTIATKTGSVTLTGSNLDSNSNGQFDMRVQRVDLDGNSISGVSAKDFTNNAWTASNTFVLQGERYFTDRGLYKILVRGSANGGYAASIWAEALYIYYAVELPEVSQVNVTTGLNASSKKTYTITFTPLTAPDEQYCSTITYSGVLSYNDGNNTIPLNFGTSNSITLSEENYGGLFVALGQTGATTSINITSTTSEKSYIVPITTQPNISFNFAPGSTTNFESVVGAEPAPTNIQFAYDFNNNNLTISWYGSETTNRYEYTLIRQDINGETEYYHSSTAEWKTTAPESINYTTNTSISISNIYLPTDNVLPYLFTISITAYGDGSVSNMVLSRYANSFTINDISSFSVNYDLSNDKFTGSWAHTDGYTLKTGSSITGSVYNVYISGVQVVSNVASTSALLDTTTLKSIVNNSNMQKQAFKLVITDAYWTVGDVKYVAYKGLEATGTITLPAVIETAPTGLTIDANDNITWNALPFATKYVVWLQKNGATYGNQYETTERSVSIDTVCADRERGDYSVCVKAVTDTSAKVYVKDDDTTSTCSYSQKVKRLAVSNLNVTTVAYASTLDFYTTITWTYDWEGDSTISTSYFLVTLTLKNTGAVYTLNPTITQESINGRSGRYSVVFDGSGSDTTRGLPAGNYTLSVVVKEEGLYGQSASATADYVNKFGLKKIDNITEVFAITPDCFVSAGDIEDHTLTPSQIVQDYETSFGFNQKYLIITDASKTKATHFRVYLNGGLVGTLKNYRVVASDILTISNEYKINLSSYIQGETNTITLMPYGDTDFYFYITTEGGVRANSLDDSNAKSVIGSDANVSLLTKYEIKTLSPQVSYLNGNPSSNDVVDVKCHLGPAVVGATYEITICYKDYYNSEVEKALTPFRYTLTNADFTENADGSKTFNSIPIFDRIRVLGPHEFWFKVKRVADNDFYLNSDVKVSDTFIFKSTLQGFTDNASATGKVSIVTAITADNEDSIAKNGMLSWTLPQHQYSIQAVYRVVLEDTGQATSHIKTFSSTLAVTVEQNGTSIKTSYSLLSNPNNYFILDVANNRLLFNMRLAYFEDEDRVLVGGVQEGTYYLAGVYKYRIEAIAYDKNGNVANYRIYSPSSFGDSRNMKTYTYKDIEFIRSPTNSQVDSDGVVTWQYSPVTWLTEDSEPEFGVIVYNKDANGSNKTLAYKTSIDDKIIGLSFNISNYLVAGGQSRNEVYVFRFAPNSYYKDSAKDEADLSSLPATVSLPQFSLSWGSATQANAVLSSDVSSLSYNDITKTSSVVLNVQILRVTSDVTFNKNSYNFDTVKSIASYVTLDLGNIDYILGVRSYAFNILSMVKSACPSSQTSNWLNTIDDELLIGVYYLKVTLKTSPNHSSYTNVTKYANREIRTAWKVYDDATISGEYLSTIVNSTITSANNNSNDKFNWSKSAEKDVNLKFRVNVVKENDGSRHIPESVVVKAKLYNGSTYDDEITLTYNIPSYDNLGSNKEYTNGDVTIIKYYEGTVANLNFMYISINLHEAFDTNVYAGIYHITWTIQGDDYGDTSDTYSLKQGSTLKGVCHYTSLPTPILDYRLGYLKNSDGTYSPVINWSLEPSNITYDINENADYSVNIYAYTKTNGVYSCDSKYNSLSAEDKALFLQSSPITTNCKYVTNKTYSTLTLDGVSRIGYVDKSSDTKVLSLVPNNQYKVFIYLSTNSSQSANSQFYLASATSVPVEYYYTPVLTAPKSVSISINNSLDLNMSGTLDSNSTAFEIWVYNTLDSTASSNKKWYEDQKTNGTYISHLIIGVKPGDTSSTKNLYLYSGYVDKKVGNKVTVGTTALGTLTSAGKVTLNNNAKEYLLPGEASSNPITYMCEIKSWTNNNEANNNALDLDNDNYLDGDMIYSKNWLKTNLGLTSTTIINRYYRNLSSKQIEVPFIDLNSRNTSSFFTFNNKSKYTTPNISSITVTGSDVVNTISKSFTTSADEPSGYLKAGSGSTDYVIRLYVTGLDDLNTIQRENLGIKVTVSSYTYNSSGVITTTKTELGSAVLKLKTGNYVEINNSTDTRNLMTSINNKMPNNLFFTIQAVKSSSGTTTTFYNNSGQVNSVVYTFIEGSSSTASSQGYAYSMIVRKQFVTPSVNVMYDGLGTELVDASSMETYLGYTTNVLKNGDYAKMAVNPYVNMTKDNLTNAMTHEYARATSSVKDINIYYYRITYNSTTVELPCFPNSTFNTTTSFSSAVSSNPARYNYSTYADIYPYEHSCLYARILKAIGSNKGGKIQISVYADVIGSEKESYTYWQGSEMSDTFTMYFYARLGVVKSTFDRSQWTSSNNYGFGDATAIAPFYQAQGYYYNYQTSINMGYTPIDTSHTYTIALSRPTYNTSGTMLSTKLIGSQTTSTISSTSSQTYNLSTLLKSIQSQHNYSTSSNQNNINYNVWRLPKDSKDVWSMNIYANTTTSDNTNFRTRGYDSKVYTYTPQLKLVNDVSSLTMTMNVSTNNDVSFSQSNVNCKTLYSNTNQAAGKLSYSILSGSTEVLSDSKNISSGTGISRYQSLFYDLVTTDMKDLSGGVYTIKFKFSGSDSNIKESDYYTYSNFKYYKQLDTSSLNITATQSGTKINIVVKVDTSLGISGMTTTLNQINVETNQIATKSSTSTSSISGTTKTFTSSWTFNTSYADCFSIVSYTLESKVKKLIEQGYVGYGNQGYIQAGVNKFTISLTQSGSSTYNLISKSTPLTAECKFIVPESLCPSVSYNGYSGSGKMYTDTNLTLTNKNSTSYYYIYLARAEYVDNVKFNYKNVYYGTYTISGSYGLGSGSYSASDSGTLNSGDSYHSYSLTSNTYNYASITMTVNCKKYFGNVFATGGSASVTKTVDLTSYYLASTVYTTQSTYKGLSPNAKYKWSSGELTIGYIRI